MKKGFLLAIITPLLLFIGFQAYLIERYSQIVDEQNEVIDDFFELIKIYESKMTHPSIDSDTLDKKEQLSPEKPEVEQKNEEKGEEEETPRPRLKKSGSVA